MIYSPLKVANNTPLSDIVKWNVFGWDIVENLNTDFADNCDAVGIGLSKSIKLANINGSYNIISEQYNDSPVYLNNKQTLFVTGPGYEFGVELNSLDQSERGEVLSLLDNGDTTYTIYRDGPYLLGKFGPDNVWAIIRLPISVAPDRIISTTSIDTQSYSVEEINQSIVVHQVITKPNKNLKNNYDRNSLYGSESSKTYRNWQNSVTPLSRDWTVNKIKIKPSQCYYQHNFFEKADSHFFVENSTIVDTNNPDEFDRKPIIIPRGVPFVDLVYAQFLALKNLFTNNNTITNPIFPPVLYTMSLRMTVGESTDYAQGVVENLGSTGDGKTILELYINGEFINNSNSKSIIYGGEYRVHSVDVLSQIDDEPITTTTIQPDRFKTDLNYIVYNLVNWTKKEMTRWCRATAFLSEPPIFKNDWRQIALNFTTDITDQSQVYLSKYTNKIHFYSDLEAKFFDRLYDFIQIKGL